MTTAAGVDLGHGVRVVPGDGDRVVVLSERLDLGWRPSAGGARGSAVVWNDASFEVVDRERWRGGDRWTLAPWSSDDVMRVVQALDSTTIASAAAAATDAGRTDRLRPVLWMLSPVLGFAAPSWQRRWRDRRGFPAVAATWLSAIGESVFGALCLMEVVVSAGAGDSVFPWIPRPLVYLGLYLFVEGLVRVVRVAADSEPVGSLFGVLASIFERPQAPPSEPIRAPMVQTFDETDGTVELASTILRRDWETPGVLCYRGEGYLLDSTRHLGDSWVYRFRRLDSGDEPPEGSLRLLPPRSTVDLPARMEAPGAWHTVLLSIACTLAPARFQRRWARQLGVRAVWFTVFGAAAELVGGWSNLAAGTNGQPVALLLNLFFVGEAVARFGSVALRGEPMGSVLGLPLRPVLVKLLPPAPPH